jgi:hypothetical protein
MGKQTLEKGTVASSSMHRELATGLSQQGAGR